MIFRDFLRDFATLNVAIDPNISLKMFELMKVRDFLFTLSPLFSFPIQIKHSCSITLEYFFKRSKRHILMHQPDSRIQNKYGTK